jgi:O-antigen ligase
MLLIIFTLVVVGILLWAVNTYVPMDGKIKNILNILVVLLVVFWLISLFIPLGAINNVKIK